MFTIPLWKWVENMGCTVDLVKDLSRGLLKFGADERGSASLEFIATLPLLMGVLVLSFEYGEAFSARERLDSAVRDATRLLARSPAIEIADGFGGTKPGLQTFFVDRARQLVQQRTGYEITEVNFPEPFISHDQTSTTEVIDTFDEDGNPTTETVTVQKLRTPFYEVFVTVTIDVDLPALAIFGGWIGQQGTDPTTLRMTARDSARYLSETPLSDTACSFVRNYHNRQNGVAEC